MSRFGISRLIGVPSVWPSKTPERIRTVSVSLRWVTRWLWPGARRSRSGWMSASDRGRRGGQPSTTAPRAALMTELYADPATSAAVHTGVEEHLDWPAMDRGTLPETEAVALAAARAGVSAADLARFLD